MHEETFEHTHEHTHADGTTHTHEHSHADATTHSHEHTHADGTTHTHEHVHDHEHSHEHSHIHTHEHSGTPIEELTAMLKYMVGHNASHVKETQELAEQLKDEKPEVYAMINDAVADFESGNAILAKALDALVK